MKVNVAPAKELRRSNSYQLKAAYSQVNYISTTSYIFSFSSLQALQLRIFSEWSLHPFLLHKAQTCFIFLSDFRGNT